MKIITWNVNSIRARMPRAEALLRRHRPDLLSIQEVKVQTALFPRAPFEALGYMAAVYGQAQRNGVALLSLAPLRDVKLGFPGDPVPDQARVISATTADGLQVVNVYVVNGKTVGSPEYLTKLGWLEAFRAWIGREFDAGKPLLVVGDFNVAPEDRDVYDPERWRGKNLCSEPERERLGALTGWGLVDLMRLHLSGPGPYTWWDYRLGALHRGWGLRIDLALGTAAVARRCSQVSVDRDERKPTFGEGKPSDHAPVIVTLDS